MQTRDFSHVSTRDVTAIARIANRRTGADSAYDFALILYTSLSCAINTPNTKLSARTARFFRKFLSLKTARLHLQLRVWVLIAQKRYVYKIKAESCAEPAPVLRFAIRAIAVASRVETCEKSPFLYTSLLCVINNQTLNCAGSFHRAPRRTAGRTVGEPWSTLSPPRETMTPLPHPLLLLSLLAWVRRFLYPSINCTVQHVFLGFFFSFSWCPLLCYFHFDYLLFNL